MGVGVSDGGDVGSGGVAGEGKRRRGSGEFSFENNSFSRNVSTLESWRECDRRSECDTTYYCYVISPYFYIFLWLCVQSYHVSLYLYNHGVCVCVPVTN